MKHSTQWYDERAAEIHTKVKSIATVTSIPGGIMAEIIGHHIQIRFWYKRHRYGFNYDPQNTKSFIPGTEHEIIRDEVIRAEKPRFEPPAIDIPKILEQSNVAVDKGTQACIDHCKRKLAFMKKGGAGDDHKGMFMLNLLIDEFLQYL